ncbi:hypothetical protein HOM83_06330 [Candidatus Falkowbacteria bacterium]|nr:hypothetical protein [Candidatus Falkowbacteria bacterium]
MNFEGFPTNQPVPPPPTAETKHEEEVAEESYDDLGLCLDEDEFNKSSFQRKILIKWLIGQIKNWKHLKTHVVILVWVFTWRMSWKVFSVW